MKRAYSYDVIPVCYPDGRVIGYFIFAANRWLGPFVSISGMAA